MRVAAAIRTCIAALLMALAPTANSAETAPDWGVLAFPGIEPYNQLELVLKWKTLSNQSYDEVAALGTTRLTATKRWNELERREGKIDTDPLKELFDAIRGRKLHVFYGLQIINTVKREVPSDLSDEPWDSPKMIARVNAILDATLPLINDPAITYVSIGNEVDVYFEKHPEELAAYLTLFRSVRAHVAAHYPNMRLGITSTYDGLSHTRKEIIAALNRDTDVMLLTYYPLEGWSARAPDSPLTDFAAMAEFAAGKPIALQEVGYPSDPAAGGSEAKQAAFVRAVFAAAREQAGRIAYFSLFLESDFSDSLCDGFTEYYDAESVALQFRASICSLGLKDKNGVAKEAWKQLTPR